MSRTLFLLLSVSFSLCAAAQQNWTNFVRTAGHGLNKSNIDRTIKDAQDTHLFGIEVDNDVPGRYNSFLDPKEKLEDIAAMAKKAHAINNHAFVYVAALECITENADSTSRTFFKEHPDWVQRNIDNKPAMFGGGDAFWISKGDEDVWISPYAMEWRKKYMEHIRQIAATGIDGIWIDIPYWMTHFTGWENSWASFDDYTVEAFRTKTGLDARKDLKLGDSTDGNFRKWIDFRIQSLTDFIGELDSNIKSVNPDCKTIPEIYPGIGAEAVRVGADVYQLYDVSDVIAHEFSGGEGNAASKNPDDWFDRMVGMYTFRAFAGAKASWMLSYSWDKENKVKPVEPMKNLALSNLMAGTNHYDAASHVMSGSNDIATRTLINKWIAANENIFYKPRKAVAPVGVYFSPTTRNYYPYGFMESFGGVVKMMLQSHIEFEVVTPRTLKDFGGNVLILPDVSEISPDEKTLFEKLLNSGKNVIDNISGKSYSAKLKEEFNGAAWKNSWKQAEFFSMLQKFKTSLVADYGYKSKVSVDASPFVSAQITSVEGKPYIFLANFSGLKKDEIVNQVPQENIRVMFDAAKTGKVFYLPFLGEKQELKGHIRDGKLICTLPPVTKGGVVWLE